ncbi:MAG: 4Fe-4S binding protein [Pseudobutyrivibrio sp.]|nr:4Fe-4S binding protein [Pseudobutyrivibrio sp.]
MKNLLVVSCVSDDIFAPISMYLMNNFLSEVVEGAKKYALELDADIMYLLPEGQKVEGLDGDVRFTSHNSPSLTNPYSVVQVLTGNLPRPMIQDDYVAVFEEKCVSVITPEAAYGIKNGFDEKFVAVNVGDKTEIKKATVGTSLLEIAEVSDAKAVLLGGLKGTFVTGQEAADTKIEATEKFNSITVYGQGECIVDACVQIMNKTYEMSCGKCVLCREGTSQFKQIVTEMTTGKAKAGDIDLIKEVSEIISLGAYCPFGQKMTNPLTSAMNLFAGEFEDHVKRKTCKCGKCYKAAELFYIDPDECVGCGDCIDACPEDAIEGKDGYIHIIDQDLCEQCGKCVSACEEGCIKTATKLPKLPKKKTKVGKW